jgi:hypothetical protein
MRLSHLALCATVALVATSSLPGQRYDKKTLLNFSAPVRIPGNVTLPKGSYVFRLLDSQSNRHIVQITNPRGDKVYNTVLAINDYRVSPTSKTVVTFGESGSCSARPVKAWYYPGDTSGSRFVYSKKEAAEIAKNCAVDVPAAEETVITAVREDAKPSPAPVVIVTRTEEKAYVPAEVAVSDAKDTTGFDAEPEETLLAQAAPAPQPAAEPRRLPATASPLGLLLTLGLGLVSAAAGIGYAIRRRD